MIKRLICFIIGHDYVSAWGSVMCYCCGRFKS